MNILYCIPHLYNSGGMERVLTQKVNWLVANTNHSITVLTTEPVPEGKEKCFFPLDKRVQVVELNLDFNADYSKPLLAKWIGHMRRMRAYKRALTNYVRAQGIDLCISLCGKEIAFLYQLPCRTIAELHFSKDQRWQLLTANHKGAFWSLMGNIRTWQLVRAVKPLECMVVLTEADKNDWNNAGCDNISVIPNPCSLDGQKTPVSSKKTNTILAVGRLHEQKGFDLLLEAWLDVEKNHPDWSLRIVGEGPKRKELEEQIVRLNLQRVLLVGQTDDMVKEYARADFFVLCSRYEGLPLVLIEAMWSGLPCISFNCPQGPAELLADERGWLVPDGNVAAMSEQIEYVMDHPTEAVQRAQKARTYAQRTYSESVIMPRWLKLIES